MPLGTYCYLYLYASGPGWPTTTRRLAYKGGHLWVAAFFYVSMADEITTARGPRTSAGKSQARWRIANRRRAVALMLDQGREQKEIAEELGVSEATVSGDVAYLLRSVDALSRASVLDKLRRDEAALLDDELQFRLDLGEAATQSGRIHVSAHILSIMRRRAELLGFDARERRKNVELERSTSELDQLLSQLDDTSDDATTDD
jgi:DNA-binding CsgD family transcriptional regulator